MGYRTGTVRTAIALLAAAAMAALAAGLWRLGTADAAAKVPARSSQAAMEVFRALHGSWHEIAPVRLPYLQFRDGRVVSGTAPLGEAGGPTDVHLAFVDYLCPYCKADHERFLALLRSRPGRRFYIVQHPVLGERSTELARIALHAASAGTFAAVHDDLMRHGLAEAPPATAAALRDHETVTAALRIKGTPTYILAGTLVFGTLRTYASPTVVKHVNQSP